MGVIEVDGDKTIERKHSSYHNLDKGYLVQNEVYKGQQYSQIYFARLHILRTLLYSLVPKWKPHLPVCTILGLQGGRECIIVGTLYKHMKLKPCILDEYAKDVKDRLRSETPIVEALNFVHPDDNLVLEDESGRVGLEGTVLLPSVHVTGVVVAVLGKETDAGTFLVQEFLEAGLPPQIEKPLKLGDNKYVVLLSGLNVGGGYSNALQFQLLVDHITGHLGDEMEQRMAAEIVHVVIAGNSVEIPKGHFNGQHLGPKDQSRLFEPIRELDISLSQIAAGVSVDIMPGPNDPANFSLPQQPLNGCLFPGSSVYNTFRSCTNPHSFNVDNIGFVGTSGQNIDDLAKYSEAKSNLDFIERTLRWRHLAPTAPNTLGCYPYTDKDPFVLESCPHVYFVGNQDTFESRLIEGREGQVTRIIAVPKFCEGGVAVMLNLRNLECHALSFEAQFN